MVADSKGVGIFDWFRFYLNSQSPDFESPNFKSPDFSDLNRLTTAWGNGDYATVELLAPQFLESTDQDVRTGALLAMADSAIFAGRFAESAHFREQGLETSSFPELRVGNLSTLGKTYALLGRFADARRIYAQSLKLIRDVPDVRDQDVEQLSMLYARFGEAFSEQGMFEEADTEFDLADGLLGSGWPLRSATNLMMRADSLRLREDYERSIYVALEAHDKFVLLGAETDRFLQSDAWVSLIIAARSEAARGHDERCRDILSSLTMGSNESPQMIQLLRICQYENAVVSHDWTEANRVEQWFYDESFPNPGLRAEFCFAIGAVNVRRKGSGARELLQSALEYYERIEHRSMPGRILDELDAL